MTFNLGWGKFPLILDISSSRTLSENSGDQADDEEHPFEVDADARARKADVVGAAPLHCRTHSNLHQ